MRSQLAHSDWKPLIPACPKLKQNERIVASPQPKMRSYGAPRVNRRPSIVQNGTYTVSLVAADLASSPVGKIVAVMESYLWPRHYSLMVSSREPVSKADGIIAIGEKKASSANVPVISIDFQGRLFEEPLTAEMFEWLQAKGNAAARAIIRRIECRDRRLAKKGTVRNRIVRADRRAA